MEAVSVVATLQQILQLIGMVGCTFLPSNTTNSIRARIQTHPLSRISTEACLHPVGVFMIIFSHRRFKGTLHSPFIWKKEWQAVLSPCLPMMTWCCMQMVLLLRKSALSQACCPVQCRSNLPAHWSGPLIKDCGWSTGFWTEMLPSNKNDMRAKEKAQASQ